MISERMQPALVVRRQENVSKCCYENVTCCKCNRTNNEKVSQINYLNKCSINVNQNSKFLTTKMRESSASSR